MKKLLTILASGILLLASCGGTSSAGQTTSSSSNVSSGEDTSNYNDLQKMFKNLADNSFTVDYYLNYASNPGEKTQTVKYTDYAIESDGYLGFHSVAQGNNLVFPYTRDSGTGKIDSLAPYLNYYSGLRYMHISDYQVTFESLDIASIVTDYVDGYYVYDYSKNTDENNQVINSLTGLYSAGSSNPTSLRFRIVGNSLMSELTGIVYSENVKDTVNANFYNVGETEIEDVKKFLDEGGTAKEFVDDRFVAFFLPYFVSYNYTVEVDLSDMLVDFPIETYKIKYTDDTMFNMSSDDERDGNGFLQYQGAVFNYDVDDEDNIDFNMALNSGTEVATYLWGEYIPMSFADIGVSNLIGYKEVVNDETVYHITDTQFFSVLTSLGTLGSGDAYYFDEVLITIPDLESDVFNVEIHFYDRSSKIDRGISRLTFSDLDNTKVNCVDRFLSTGEEAESQDKEEFASMMELFKTNNYVEYLYNAGSGEFDLLKYVYNEKYYYTQWESSIVGGTGYLLNGSTVNEFTINDSETNGEVSISGTVSNISLPGTAQSFGITNDLTYLSAPTVYNGTVYDAEGTKEVREDLYDMNNYVVDNIADISFWRNTSSTVLNWADKYFRNILLDSSGMQVYEIECVGFQTSMKDENETQYNMNKVTFFLFVEDLRDGRSYLTSFTYYHVGHANIDVIDEYISGLN